MEKHNLHSYRTLSESAAEVREELGKTYKFRDSSYGLHLFDPRNPGETAYDVLKSVGASDKSIPDLIAKYVDGTCLGSCVYTFGGLGFDYVILLSASPATFNLLYYILGEEITHGEHATEHNKHDSYTKTMFSDISREFIGGSGGIIAAKKFMDIRSETGKIRASYDEDTNTFSFDISHMIGYELARNAAKGEDEWKSSMFHAPAEKELWSVYNEVLVPDIGIMLPPALDDKDGLKKYIDEHIKSLGLKCNIDFAVDESDTRGSNYIQIVI